MLEKISLVIAGVQMLNDVFLTLKGIKSGNTKAKFTINRVLTQPNCVAMNISVINCSDVPFSILDMFIEDDGQRYSVCRIIDTGNDLSLMRGVGYAFKTDMYQYNFCGGNFFSLEPFNIHAYLLEN